LGFFIRGLNGPSAKKKNIEKHMEEYGAKQGGKGKKNSLGRILLKKGSVVKKARVKKK